MNDSSELSMKPQQIQLMHSLESNRVNLNPEQTLTLNQLKSQYMIMISQQQQHQQHQHQQHSQQHSTSHSHSHSNSHNNINNNNNDNNNMNNNNNTSNNNNAEKDDGFMLRENSFQYGQTKKAKKCKCFGGMVRN